MGGRSENDSRRDRFPGNTDGRYGSDCRHRITKDLYPDDLKKAETRQGHIQSGYAPVFQQISK